MSTAASLVHDDVLLVGVLGQHRRGPIVGRPYLSLLTWCPACRTAHAFPWPDEFRLDAVIRMPAPCPRGPWAGGSINVGRDPERQAENRRALEAFAAILRWFSVERRLRLQLSADRA